MPPSLQFTGSVQGLGLAPAAHTVLHLHRGWGQALGTGTCPQAGALGLPCTSNPSLEPWFTQEPSESSRDPRTGGQPSYQCLAHLALGGALDVSGGWMCHLPWHLITHTLRVRYSPSHTACHMPGDHCHAGTFFSSPHTSGTATCTLTAHTYSHLSHTRSHLNSHTCSSNWMETTPMCAHAHIASLSVTFTPAQSPAPLPWWNEVGKSCHPL